jgi:membrane-associated phospholipid phosphatase
VIAAIVARISSHSTLKLRLSAALTLFFCVPYFALQRFVYFPVRELPMTSLDTAIPFAPQWVWIYQSIYLLISVVPWLAVHAEDLRWYARGFVIQAGTAFLCFFLTPIHGPRPAVVPHEGMFGLLVSYDAPLNSFPSLHVALAVSTCALAARLARDLRPRLRVAIVGIPVAWTMLIAYAAVATRQHYVVDIPAGALLACASVVVAGRTSRRTASTPTARPRQLGAALPAAAPLSRKEPTC